MAVTPYDKNGKPVYTGEKKKIVTIAVTGNGYIVFPDGTDSHSRSTGALMSWESIYSFDNIESLIFFLRENMEEPRVDFKQAVFDAIKKGEL
jgi:hypothetical protein